jgi:hypothetical protein
MDGLTNVERTVLDAIARGGPDGILMSALRRVLEASVDPRVVTQSIEVLARSDKVQVKRAATAGDPIVSLKKPPMSENFNIVMGVVRGAGTSGIDVAGIIAQTKIPKAEVAKAINQFIQQDAMRETRCFTNKARKLYIASEFEPSNDVTGGIFYTEARD